MIRDSARELWIYEIARFANVKRSELNWNVIVARVYERASSLRERTLSTYVTSVSSAARSNVNRDQSCSKSSRYGLSASLTGQCAHVRVRATKSRETNEDGRERRNFTFAFSYAGRSARCSLSLR